MNNVHFLGDLQQMRSLPLESKICMSSRRIERWYKHWSGQVYLCFSGGKKSLVLKHLVDEIFSDVPSVFISKKLEYPKIIEEIFYGKYECFNSDISIFPSRYIYQKLTCRKPYVAKIIEEGTPLEKRWMKRGCNEFKAKNGKSIPLSFWTSEDIEEYIRIRMSKIVQGEDS